MIKPEELRIGNKVWFDKRKIVEVTAIGKDSLYYKEQDWTGGFWSIDAFEPIPLSPEWLTCAGFKVDEADHWCFGDFAIHLPDKKTAHPLGRVYFNSWAILQRSPATIHELQNMVYTLSGSELTFKDL